MLLDIATSAIGLLAPAAVDLVKSIFGKAKNDDEALAELALKDPAGAAQFVSAKAALLEAKAKYFNRDVIGIPSLWVVNLRASIRPIFTIFSLALMIAATFNNINIDPSIKALMEITISSWFGSRMVK